MHTICRESKTTTHFGTITANSSVTWGTTQFSNFRTVEAFAETVGVQSTHHADADVATLARSGFLNFLHVVCYGKRGFWFTGF